MSNKALVVIDIQNDITKHYRDIIDTINAAIRSMPPAFRATTPPSA